MHRICGSPVNKRGRDDLFPRTSAVLFNSYVYINVLNEFFKLCQILADFDQRIQWCMEHNLLVSSIKCPREIFSNAWTWRRRASSRDGYESPCSRRDCNGKASMRNENRVGSQTKPASYRNIQRSLRKLSTGMVVASALWRRSFWKPLSSTSPTYTKYAKMCKLFLVLLYDFMYCSCSNHHFMRERNKKHSFNAWAKLEEGNQGAKPWNDTMKVSNKFISLRFHLQN